MFIGMDIGSSSVKAVAMVDGKRCKAKAEYPSGTGALEQDAVAVAETVAECFRRLISENSLSAESIRGIGLCGHGPSIVFVDEAGQAKSTVVTWQDHRAAPQAARLRELIPGFSKDGTSFEAKLLWSWENQKELFDAGYTPLYPKDYLLGLLCGRVCMDESTASAITYYNRASRTWDTLGLFPRENLPKVVSPWEAAGVTGTEFSRFCGLPDSVAIYPGGIDCFCEAVGAGGVNPGLVVDGTGTSTCLTRVAKRGEGVSYHVLPDMDLSVNMISSTGASFKWFCEKIDAEGTEVIGTLDPATPTKLLFLP
ncbi:MAG: FGGY-family carbohydrate kinase, partial [Clostridia bacterium]|nr:FGGY-family carbohydrate kinase [Clostridia bacterium]